ncbi:MAG: ATP-grasp domain-containing protein [Chloroflexi bacterium]|nr:ATP-grasp domain-containing protein [Chloroflexota bacterium]
MTERIRVGVVLGGRSSEREISLESGRNIFHNLDPSRFDKLAIYMDRRGRLWEIGLPLLLQNTTRDIEDRLADDATRIRYEALPERVDFVYIGLHGKYGEDGCFQGLLELLDLPYSGSGVLGAALGMDKRVQRHLLRQAGIDVPRTRAVTAAGWAEDRAAAVATAAEAIGLPCVVKPAREGCSTALAVARSTEALEAALEEALRWDTTALVEELLDGAEVTVVVLEENGRPRAFPPTETPPLGDFLTIEEKFLPGQGVNVTPARLPEAQLAAVMETAERAFVALGLRVFARMDMYVTESGRVVLGEPNTLPGSSPSSTIFLGPMEEGIGPFDLITRIVDGSLAAHAAKRGPLD